MARSGRETIGNVSCWLSCGTISRTIRGKVVAQPQGGVAIRAPWWSIPFRGQSARIAGGGDPTGLKQIQVPVSGEKLTKGCVRTFRRLIQDSPDLKNCSLSARCLHGWLVAPLYAAGLSSRPGISTLVVVAEGRWTIPMGAFA